VSIYWGFLGGQGQNRTADTKIFSLCSADFSPVTIALSCNYPIRDGEIKFLACLRFVTHGLFRNVHKKTRNVSNSLASTLPRCYLKKNAYPPKVRIIPQMRVKLTAAQVESLKAPAHGQQEYWDKKLPGFGLRVSQGGRKTWTLLYRHQKLMRRLTVGTYPPLSLADARDMAKAKLAEVQRGLDPATLKQEARDADTFAAVAERYLAEHAHVHKKASSVYEDEKILRRALLPAWGKRKAADIKRRDVIALVDGIATRAPIAANRTLSLASKIFNFALSKEIIAASPAYRIPKPGKEQTRERALSDDEIERFSKAIQGETADIAALFELLLRTGQRRSEVVEMRWDELDLGSGWWLIPAERTKNKRSHRIPLVGRAIEILKARAAEALGQEFVFPGRRDGQAYVNMAKPLARIIERMGSLARAAKEQPQAPFTIHDLRRTAATGMARAGVSGAVISRVLNHVTASTGGSRITLIYNRYEYDEEKRMALLKWEERLRTLLDERAQLVAAAV
jgi:integrase